ncbi:FBP domain-containing protein [Streptomyces sp. TRM66268-LWL]|uniref:FBP domain-containing protein n=1 Tax=Streptomyces polyasparticus TaxID=2767826 RepID=A0ABR7SK91_9ACTN|nr:FBP domain-containing protein [Streptomyces polyasparticus]MBC9715890.1 FBP domain-containing protein [Streptomyces polyasparticus]
MKPLTESDIRTSFVNCSKGEAKRLNIPRDLAERPWDDLDYLGWRDPQAPDRAYLVAEIDGRLQGVVLRAGARRTGQARPSMCRICLTAHEGGVPLMVAPRAGEAGKQGNSVGVYMCGELDCSLYARGIKQVRPSMRLGETLTVEERVARMVTNLEAFLTKVTH